MSDYIIELEKVGCQAGCRHLINSVSWKVKEGEHWVVFGMNGSGKTTLLSVIAGYKHFTTGSVRLFGEQIAAKTIFAIRKRIGWVSSSFFDKFYTKESVLDVVLSGKTGALGLNENISLKDVALAKMLLVELSLDHKYDRPFEILSKGEQQNVLIARALISNPDILILDEPCSGLDVYNRSYLFSTIESLSKQKNLTIIYVTHYVEEILPLFKKVLLLKNGIVFAQGDIEQVFKKAVFENLIGYPLELTQNEKGRYQLEIDISSKIGDILMEGEL